MLVWLMVLAVPLQGVAGTAMQHCSGAAGRAGQPPSAVAAPHEHGPMAGQAASVVAAGIDHHHGAADEPAGSAAAASQPAPASAPEADHQCSACAACCPALGLPAGAVPLTPPLVAATADLLLLVRVDSFVPSGLDRPPRAPAA